MMTEAVFLKDTTEPISTKKLGGNFEISWKVINNPFYPHTDVNC